MASGDRAGVGTNVDCAALRELLPWYARGTLAADDRAGVERHLDDCDGCRAELSDVRRALWIASRHLPAELLADYGAGLPLGDWPRELIESHLADCADCRADIALDGEADAAPTAAVVPLRPPPPVASLRRLALAAGLVAAIAAGWIGGRFAAGPSGGPGLPGSGPASFVELEPESARTRAAGEVSTAMGGAPLVLLLRTDLVAEAGDYRLRVERVDGTLLDELRGLAPDASGSFAVVLDVRGWPAGELRLVLDAADASSPGDFAPFERYRLQLGG